MRAGVEGIAFRFMSFSYIACICIGSYPVEFNTVHSNYIMHIIPYGVHVCLLLPIYSNDTI